MLTVFRNFLRSRLGMFVGLVVLGLIAFAFAGMDISSNNMFGGVAGGNRVAVVGDRKIATSELNRSATATLERLKQQQPTLTMEVFLNENGLDRVLDQLIDRHAIAAFAESIGLRAGDRLVDSEIVQIPAFRGPDGNFDEDAYRQLLQQQGLTDQMVRDDLAQGLLAQQLMVPASFGAVASDGLVDRYAGLLHETRSGKVGFIPSEAYAPDKDPTDKQLQTFYSSNRKDYIRPERRVIRYVTFGADALGDLRDPTDAEIAARYQRDRKLYAASESRSFTQLVVPTEAAAKAIKAEVESGTGLEAAARAKGLVTSDLSKLTQDALAGQSSQQVAQAAFRTAKGSISPPAKSNLGWHLLRVNSVETKRARSLAEVRTELVSQLKAEQRKQALAELTTRIEDQIDEGGSLAEAAKELKVEIKTTPPVTADGSIYLKPVEKAPAELARTIPTAFAMDEGESQLAEVEPGVKFVVFEVSEIAESAPAPLKEIREKVVADYKLSNGLASAKAAAERVMARLDKGQTMQEALREEKKVLPPPDSVSMNRDQLAEFGRRPPGALALMFSMAEGTVKRLEAPRKFGWIIVKLDDIEPQDVKPGDPELKAAKAELGQIAGQEYQEQLRRAIRDQIGIERNESAIAAVRRQLGGEI